MFILCSEPISPACIHEENKRKI